MKKYIHISAFLISLFCIMIISCKSSNEVIHNSITRINNNCPITIMNLGVIEKAEYEDKAIVFHISTHLSAFDGMTFSEIKRLENSETGRNAFMAQLFSNSQVCLFLRDITMSMAEEENLSFKVIYKIGNSGDEIQYKIPWREIKLVTNNILKK